MKMTDEKAAGAHPVNPINPAEGEEGGGYRAYAKLHYEKEGSPHPCRNRERNEGW